MSSLSYQYLSSRRSPDYVVIEGFYAINHALLFNAEVKQIHTDNKELVIKFVHKHCPELMESFLDKLKVISTPEFNSLSPSKIDTRIIALAPNPNYTVQDLDPNKPVIYLENIKNLNNLGAIIRSCAAKGVAGVCFSGDIDPFHPTVVRGSKGTHFAMPVIKTNLDKINRPIVSFDETGQVFDQKLNSECVVVFGSERENVSKATLDKSEKVIAIPMQPNISSLNVACAVSIAIYKWF